MSVNDLKRAARSWLCRPVKRLLNRIDPPVVVLLYHRVATLPCDPELLAVTPDNFRAQLRHLKENFPVVRFPGEWTKVAKPSVAITFDDGYADNLLEALPILEELELPATFFVATGSIGREEEFWWHQLERIFLGQSPLPPRFKLNDEHSGKSWSTVTRREREELYRELVGLLKDGDTGRRTQWLDRIRDWSGIATGGAGIHRTVTPEELRLLAASPWVTIGAHTVSHSRLSSLPPRAQREEIRGSKEQLEGWLGKEISTFSYPFGRRSDYTRCSVALCREAGFTKAASNFPGQAHRWSDPYQIPRHLVRDWPVEIFSVKLKGFWTR